VIRLHGLLMREAGEATAKRHVDRIRDRVEALRALPESAPLRPELGERRRLLVVRPWVVIYEVSGMEIRVLRIVHGARDLPRLLMR
jgi:toxin ParE1/3/4